MYASTLPSSAAIRARYASAASLGFVVPARKASVSSCARRASRATCSTSFRSIMRVDLLEVRVLQREALAPHAREAHGHHDILTFSLHSDDEAFPESRVPDLGTDFHRKVVVTRHGQWRA